MSGIFNGNETQKVQRIIMCLAVTEKPAYNTPEIAYLAGVKVGIAGDTLDTAECIEVERTGGPKKYRTEESNNTIRKTFDALDEPKKEGAIPNKCLECKFTNLVKTTLLRNRKTVGCLILKQRSKNMGLSNE